MQTGLRLKPEIIVLIVYLFYLFILTMKPFEFFVPSEIEYHWSGQGFYNGLNVMDFVLNIFLFIPFGFLLFLVMKNALLRYYFKILFCGILAAILSSIIETCQLFLPRAPGPLDIFTNTTGAIIGAALAAIRHSGVAEAIRHCWDRLISSKPLLTSAVILQSVVIFSLSIFPIHADFGNWDPSFTFQLGNEATLDRPWVGKMYLVSIYNRDLSDAEVYANFNAGPYSNDGNRVKEGLIVSYDFKESEGRTVYDISGFGSPLNLIISDSSRVKWLSPNGLEILDATIIKSQDTFKKLYSDLKSTGKLTVEAWIAPNSIVQRGPARIVSFSKDPDLRNFTLGQERENLHFRLRIPLAEEKDYVNLEVEDVFVTAEIQHLVVTYKDILKGFFVREGIEKFFLNGVEYANAVFLENNRFQSFFGSNLLSKAAFVFFSFFP